MTTLLQVACSKYQVADMYQLSGSNQAAANCNMKHATFMDHDTCNMLIETGGRSDG